jgi:PKD domain
VQTGTNTTFTPGAHNLDANPMFASSTDLRLLASSPLLGLVPGPLASGESSTDLGGLPRLLGGHADVGAYQHIPPTVTATASPQAVQTHTSVAFTASGTELVPNDPLTFGWSFDDGGIGTGTSVGHPFAAAGQHTGIVTATDKYGFTATGTATVTVTTPSQRTAAPTVGRLRQTHATWRTGGKPVSIRRVTRRPPLGTKFAFTLDQSATLTLTFTRHQPGHRIAGKCKTGRGRTRCTITLSTGRLSLAGHPGTDAVSFQGTVGRRRLKPGSYTLTVVATNPAGQVSKAQSISFKIVK